MTLCVTIATKNEETPMMEKIAALVNADERLVRRGRFVDT